MLIKGSPGAVTELNHCRLHRFQHFIVKFELRRKNKIILKNAFENVVKIGLFVFDDNDNRALKICKCFANVFSAILNYV